MINTLQIGILVDAGCQHAAHQLSECKTREECMEVRRVLRDRAAALDRMADEDCYDRANELDRKSA